jgi:hypothetical protein
MAGGVELAPARAPSRPASSPAPPAPATGAPAPPTLFTRFAQQDLAGWSPIPTPRALVLYFLAVAILCAALGGPLLAASLGVVEVSARYDDAGALRALAPGAREAALAAAGGDGVPVTVNVTVPRAMRPPVGRQGGRRGGDRRGRGAAPPIRPPVLCSPPPFPPPPPLLQ